ncbi:MAG: CRISPR-associated endonuclease Cas1, partial [Acidobacteriaceae bacterium]|nr:CRISPR-associated endonuclease Cas1 [Acidobacteriaceae bacterium]
MSLAIDQLGSLTRADLVAAFARVQENAGCAGVDGVAVPRFAARLDRELDTLYEQLSTGRYRPLPLLQIEIEKRPGQPQTRLLLVPAVRDRVLQTAVARRLAPALEEQFLDTSHGYRPGRGVDSAVARVQQWRDRGYAFVVEADVTGYFDHVDHDLLLAEYAEREPTREFDALLRRWVKGEIWDGDRVRPLTQGIPQGSPLSPLLANLFLADFDAAMGQTAGRLVRYADDFVLLCRSREEAEETLAAVEAWMGERRLSLKAEKTGIRNFFSGFTFLGVFFHGDAAFQPWKRDRREGRIVSMARPMPPRLLSRYAEAEGETEMELAFAAAGLRRVAPGREFLTDRREESRPVAYLYVTEQAATVRKSGDRFLVEKSGQVLADLPYHKLEAVLLFGGVQVTSQALGEMLEKRITVSFFSRSGRYRGSAVAPVGKDVPLRMAQYGLTVDTARALPLARRLVAGKLANAARVLARYGKQNGRDEGAALGSLAEWEQRCGEAESGEVLMGLEGAAARLYFERLMGYQRSEFVWPGRVRRPSTDPINALLSLAYTLVMQEMSGMLEGHGLDPACGFHHQPDYGRPSLALDLMEPFRGPAADRLVVTVLNKRMLTEGDFYTGEGGAVFLKAESMRQFFEWYERWMIHEPKGGGVAFREGLRRQAERFARELQGKGEWVP